MSTYHPKDPVSFWQRLFRNRGEDECYKLSQSWRHVVKKKKRKKDRKFKAGIV
jgi:hypothetical protein